MPRTFEILEHIADVGFRVRAATLAELFEAAADALVALAIDASGAALNRTFAITVEGDSIESLLVNWLSEILYCLDGEKMAIAQCKVRELGEHRVTGDAIGEPRDPERHAPRLVIKGVTYHQLKIREDDNGWWCEVYLDV